MANAKKCDKCGKFYTNNLGFFKSGEAVAAVRLFDKNHAPIAYYDLCDDCACELGYWLDNLRRIVHES